MALTLFVASSATAQTPPPPIAIDVIVTAERGDSERDHLAVATAVLDRQAIASRPVVSLADAIQHLPGFQIVAGDASATPATIARGFFGGGEAEYVTLLVDGVPWNDTESGVAPWHLLPALSIERIEAVRGPASATYGDTAIGGVIQVFSSKPVDRSWRASVDGGSFESASASLGVTQSIGTASVQSVAAYRRGKGFRQHNGLSIGHVTAAVSGGVTRPWSARVLFNGAERDEPGPLEASASRLSPATSQSMFQLDHESIRRTTAAAHYGIATAAVTSRILGSLTVRNVNRIRTLLLAPGIGDRADRAIDAFTFGVSIENTVDRGAGLWRGRWRFGGDVFRDVLATSYGAPAVSENTTHSDPRRARLAAFASHALDLGARTSIVAGIRWDRIHDRAAADRVSHQAWSPRAGVTVVFGHGLTLFSQASQSFKTPTLDQLFDSRPFPDFQGGTLRISNAALLPQRAASIEGGIRQSVARHRWELLIYRMQVKDEIDFDPATFSYGNIGRSRHDGVELDVRAFRGARLSAGATYASSRVYPAERAARVRQLKNIPRHLFRSDATLRLPFRTTVFAQYTRTAGAYADDDNTVPLAGRSTIDMRISKSMSRWTLRVDALNVTNHRYEEIGFLLRDFRGRPAAYFYPAAPFSFRIGADVSF